MRQFRDIQQLIKTREEREACPPCEGIIRDTIDKSRHLSYVYVYARNRLK